MMQAPVGYATKMCATAWVRVLNMNILQGPLPASNDRFSIAVLSASHVVESLRDLQPKRAFVRR